jgi:hypothetical protein
MTGKEKKGKKKSREDKNQNTAVRGMKCKRNIHRGYKSENSVFGVIRDL